MLPSFHALYNRQSRDNQKTLTNPWLSSGVRLRRVRPARNPIRENVPERHDMAIHRKQHHEMRLAGSPTTFVNSIRALYAFFASPGATVDIRYGGTLPGVSALKALKLLNCPAEYIMWPIAALIFS